MIPRVLFQKKPLEIRRACLFALVAVVSFHLAYGVPMCQGLMVVFLYCLFRLANLPTARQTFYFGMVIGLAVYAPHLIFFWSLFGQGAVALWCILPLWLSLFLLVGRACLIRFGPAVWAIAAPFLWTGLEYFRSELYYLRFSWLNVGYAFSNSPVLPFMAGFGVYGIGFLLMAWAAFTGVVAELSNGMRIAFMVTLAALSTLPLWLPNPEITDVKTMNVTGIQLEGSSSGQVKSALGAALKKYPQTDLFVLSEYAFLGPIPQDVLDWCKQHGKWLAAGGEDPVSTNHYCNTVFVVGWDGSIVFRQGKSVPVQFMDDGLPASEQNVWNSPWGLVGFAICYDASYTRVMDELIRHGAQALIVPTMDSAEWGKAEHQLHGLIAPMRAAEYSVPIFRLCSSGISQSVSREGRMMATAPFPGQDEMLSTQMELARPGRIPFDRLVAQLGLALSVILLVFMMVDAWWTPRPHPES